MSYKNIVIFIGVLALVLTTADQVAAQSSGDRGRFSGFIERLDRNGDGNLSPDEIPPLARPHVQRMAERAGLDPSKPLKLSALLETLGRDGGGRDSRDSRGGDRGRNESPRSAANFSSGTQKSKDKKKNSPGVPGFGVVKADKEQDKPVPGFDVPLGFVPLEERFTPQVIQYVERIMRRYDKDQDDILNPEEMKTVSWRSDPKPSDLNGDGSLSKAEMCARIAKRWQTEREGAARWSVSTTPGDSKANPSSQGSDSSNKFRSYAKSLLTRYDANKNGVLERDEWTKMSGNPEKADVNKNGIVTLDELVARLDRYSRGGSSASSPDTATARSSTYRTSRRSRDDTAKRKTYRAASPLERLPRGLPSWFTRNDANEDGQIAMSEFTTAWNDEKAAEFARYDLNSDGVITPDEYLDASKKKDEKKVTVASPPKGRES